MMTLKSNSYLIAENVNLDINSRTTYKTDLQAFGTSDWWVEADGFGDCEDYALLKRVTLLSKGWSSADVWLACCWAETGEYHCALLVNTNKGWYVLDNRYQWPMTPKSLPYKWDKVLKEDGKWYEIDF